MAPPAPEPLREGASRLSFNRIIEHHFCLCGRDTSQHMLTLWGSAPELALQFKLLFVELIINIVKTADGAL